MNNLINSYSLILEKVSDPVAAAILASSLEISEGLYAVSHSIDSSITLSSTDIEKGLVGTAMTIGEGLSELVKATKGNRPIDPRANF